MKAGSKVVRIPSATGDQYHIIAPAVVQDVEASADEGFPLWKEIFSDLDLSYCFERPTIPSSRPGTSRTRRFPKSHWSFYPTQLRWNARYG